MKKTYYDKVHTWGRIWSITALLVLFSVPLAISVYYNAWPEMNNLFSALLKVLPIFWISAVVEVITYTPMLGAGGTYLSFVTGNITNLKLPCALDAMEKAKVKANSEEGEIIPTISIAVSRTSFFKSGLMSLASLSPFETVLGAIPSLLAISLIVTKLFPPLNHHICQKGALTEYFFVFFRSLKD